MANPSAQLPTRTERISVAIAKADGLTQNGLWNHNNPLIPSVVEVMLARALAELDGLWVNHDREVHLDNPEDRPLTCPICAALRSFCEKVAGL